MMLFTEAQLRELELQTLIFNHLASGTPIPPHLISHFKRSLYFLDPCSLSPSMSYGKRAEEDQEPWRCKRTDGKKWRCSKEAFQDSKYCERHMHRGKKSSRKLVEILPKTSAAAAANTNLFLGSPSCYNFLKDEEKQHQQQQKHCYVLGADLMLKNPVRVDRAQETKPLLCLFSTPNNDQEEAYYSKTQLSISIP